MKKRVISLFVILAIVLALFPVSVLAATPVSVTIGGIALSDGKYLPSNGDHLCSFMPFGGFAILNGNVLTLCNFHGRALFLRAKAGRAAPFPSVVM